MRQWTSRATTGAILLAACAALAVEPREAHEQWHQIQAVARARLTMSQAMEVAQKAVTDAVIVAGKLEFEGEAPIFEVTLLRGNRFSEVEIDAMTGKVLEVEEKTATPNVWTFDIMEPGKTPEGWMIRENHPTKRLGQWTVETDPSAPSPSRVLKLATENDNATYNLAIVERLKVADLDISVKLKAHTGKHDQGGGLIWRARDPDNYYICRINPLESNYRVYKVADGKRTQLQSADVETVPGKWYTVRSVMIGDRIRCYLDGKKLLDVRDAMFAESGQVGLWTKADACTSFDDLVVLPAAGRDEPNREKRHGLAESRPDSHEENK